MAGYEQHGVSLLFIYLDVFTSDEVLTMMTDEASEDLLTVMKIIQSLHG